MKRYYAKELMPVIQAYSEGRTIQIKNDDGTWEDAEDLAFVNSPDCYRIKPESEYRPYKSCDEMVYDFCKRFNLLEQSYKMPSIWVTNRDNGCREMILGFGASAVLLPNAIAKDMNELFEQYTFLDGSVCGVKE